MRQPSTGPGGCRPGQMSAFDVFLGRPTQWVASLPRRAPHTRLPRAQAPYLEPRPPAPRLPERHWLAHPRPRRARTHRRRVSLMCARDGLSRSAAWAACDRPCGRSAAAICCRAPSHGGTWRRSLSATGVGFKVSRGPLVPGAAPAGPPGHTAAPTPPSVSATPRAPAHSKTEVSARPAASEPAGVGPVRPG